MAGEFTCVGRIKKSHGLNGELRLLIEEKYLEDVLNSKVLFFGKEPGLIPYFIEEKRSFPNLIVRLEDVTSRELADEFGRSEIFIPTDQLLAEEEKEIPMDEGSNFLEGYTLKDEDLNSLGEIIRIDKYPQQEMIIVLIKGKERLIPLHESLIRSLDEDNRILSMEIPEGLLEL